MENPRIDTPENIKKAEEILGQIGLPPQPRAVMDIRREMARPDPDFQKIVHAVSADVALSAATLKITNSAFFGGLKTDSIHHALLRLGLGNFYSIVLTTALYNAMGCGTNHTLDKFRKHSSSVALVCSHITQKLQVDLEDAAYTLGLFHDCGVPLLLKKFPDYAKMADYALPSSPLEGIPDYFESVVGLETDRYNTNHCIMGYIMAKSWGLSDNLLSVLLNHHNISMRALKDPSQRRLLGILFLAEFVCQSCDPDTYAFHQHAPEWHTAHRRTLEVLGIHAVDIRILEEESCEIIKNNDWL
jgi:HD-like signal output (HDOD) protein